MPGKQVGMSEVRPDRLAGTIPICTIMPRTTRPRRPLPETLVRGHDLLPHAGGERGPLQGLEGVEELVSSYQGPRGRGRGPSIVNSIIAAAYSCNLDKDVKNLPDVEFDSKDVDLERRDTIVGMVYQRLMEIE